MKKRLESLLVEYGAIGLVTYLTSTCLVYVTLLLALQFGWRPSGAAATGGVWIAAYIGTKITQPFRIMGAIAVTPFLARGYEKLTGRRSTSRTEAL